MVVGAAHMGGGQPSRKTNVKGYVRGFDVRTGKRKWIFPHHPAQKASSAMIAGCARASPEQAGNTGCWAQISIDPELNTAYLPVELPTGDETGIYRAGNALFGESIVAVDLDTGKRKWHYQTCHHGLWGPRPALRPDPLRYPA